MGPNFARAFPGRLGAVEESLASLGTSGTIGEAFKSASGNENFPKQKFVQKTTKTCCNSFELMQFLRKKSVRCGCCLAWRTTGSSARANSSLSGDESQRFIGRGSEH